MTSSFTIYLFVGKILIFFGGKFAKENGITSGFLGKLFACPLCWGFWAYTALSFLMGEIIFKDFYYIPFLSQVITGAISSFFVHLSTLGWREQFEIIIVER